MGENQGIIETKNVFLLFFLSLSHTECIMNYYFAMFHSLTVFNLSIEKNIARDAHCCPTLHNSAMLPTWLCSG